ncbi:PepSY domain-containing protein [Aeromicrobium alkaliterrae]|uniref:PepSY domain-containing protein n=1 Tax=Aeromicrobium alkaliterrae TaxID=302168 RepID=A0ABP4VIG5_9ACTN
MNNETPNPTSPNPSTETATAPRRRKGLVIAGVATAVVLAVGAGTVLTLALTGDDDPVAFQSASSNSGSSSSTGDTDVDAMIAAADEALTVADGEVVGIEQQADGAWRVEIEGDGREYDVFVDASGARIAEQDGDGDSDGLGLTADSLTAIVETATATVDGEVVQIGSDDNRYTVEVRPATGPAIELELDESFQVVGSETDD